MSRITLDEKMRRIDRDACGDPNKRLSMRAREYAYTKYMENRHSKSANTSTGNNEISLRKDDPHI